MKNSSVSFVVGVLGLAVLMLPALGCGEARKEVKVTGKVTVDGVPIEKGAITFLSDANDGPSSGGIITNGEYVASVAPGSKIVMVIGSKVTGERLRLEGVPDSGKVESLETVTHANYNTREHSPLRAKVDAATTGLDFKLTKDGKGS